MEAFDNRSGKEHPPMNTDHLTDEQLQNELVRPDHEFQGNPLWPWSRAAKHLWRMLCVDEIDLTIFQWLSMMWVLRRDGTDAASDLKAKILRVYRSIDDVRAEIILGRDQLTQEDEEEAGKIHDAILKAELDSRIHVSPEGQKKTGVTALLNGDTSAISSESVTGGPKKKRSTKRQSSSKT